MLIASFDPEVTLVKKSLFRGETVFFWLGRIFGNIAVSDPEKIRTNFNFLIIFDPTKFLDIEPDGIKKILSSVHRKKNESEIFSIPGFPFFIFSKAVLKRFSLKIEKGICKKLTKHPKVNILKLKETYRILDVQKNVKKVEEIIVNFQINDFNKQKITVEDYGHFYIEGKVEIGKGSKISSGVVITGNSRIGKNVTLYPNSYIENSVIADNSVVLPSCVIRDSFLEKGVQVGPYTHLRAGSVIRSGGKAGNFVEMKKSVLGRGSKSMHLSYIGDAIVGENVNIGAGTITCNYDGIHKHETKIKDNVFIGSGTKLVAPVKVGKNSYIGAGSTITEDVPADSLAIARSRQVNKKGWTKKKKQKP
jgi:bifunctional UDP-N-acetylglucosamine pyrophosphorylase/glucosamine-1-phosphate N-acetyltransferase